MVNRALTSKAQGGAMRRLVVSLVLSFLLVAPATAQQGRIAAVQPARDAALRGSISAQPVAPPEETPLLLPLPVQPTSMSSDGVSGARCRTSCSQQYYFCLSGQDDQCPQYWSRCVSGCGT